MNDRIEILVLGNLIFNEEFTRKVIPYLKEYHFGNYAERQIFLSIKGFVTKYNALPTREAILIEVEKKKIKEEQYDQVKSVLRRLKKKPIDLRWLLDKTEKFCQLREVDHAVDQAVDIRNAPDFAKRRGEILSLFREASSVSFDPNVGHDYLLDAEERFNHYNREEEKIPFDIELLNKATLGGIEKGTLNIFFAGTGVGKTMCMCHFAASQLLQGKNVLYITLEMSRFEISRRVDANLFDVSMNDVKKLSRQQFFGYVDTLRKKTVGKFVIKQYPTASASVLHFKHLLDELRLKKKFYPDVVLVDYLNICNSSRIKTRSGSFDYVKAVSEEMRGLAGEEGEFAMISGTQSNREGLKKSGDLELWDTAESIGVPFTADLQVAIMPCPEVDRFQFKILKNRYNDIHEVSRFLVGVDRKKMRLFDVDESSDFDQDREHEDLELTYEGNGHNGNGNGNGKIHGLTQARIKKTLDKFKGRGAFHN